MNKLHADLLNIIGAAVKGTVPELVAPIDWDNIYTLLCRAKLHGVTFRTISNLSEDLLPPAELLSKWKFITFNNGIRQMFIKHQLSAIYDKAQSLDLQLTVFKGITLATLYPEPNMRFSSDADILVSPSQRPQAENLFIEMGYSKDESASKKHVPVYRINKNGHTMAIELHDSLWEDYEGKQTMLLDAMELTKDSTLLTDSFLGLRATTMGYTEHLIYQIFHIAKHFAFEGLPLRYLTDITVYINAHDSKIDYARFWDALKLLKYDVFTCAILRVCEDYFGLIPRIIPKEHLNIKVDDAFLLDLIYAGKVDEHEIENWASTEMISSFFLRQNEAATSKFQRWKSTFFPNADELKDHFSYAQKYRFLLPIAWIHRFIRATKYHFICKSKGYSSVDTLCKANYRISLLCSLDMLENK